MYFKNPEKQSIAGKLRYAPCGLITCPRVRFSEKEILVMPSNPVRNKPICPLGIVFPQNMYLIICIAGSQISISVIK